MAERQPLDNDSLKNNKNLENLIKTKIKYNIPLLILLTHSDNYCDEVKKNNKDDWKNICKDKIINNKKNLLEYINDIEIRNKSKFKIKQDDVMHIVLVEPKQITDEEAIEKLMKNKKIKEKYEKAQGNEKKIILDSFKDGLESTQNENRDFFDEEKMNILDQKELIIKIKQYLPSQYYSALIDID